MPTTRRQVNALASKVRGTVRGTRCDRRKENWPILEQLFFDLQNDIGRCAVPGPGLACQFDEGA